MTDAVFASSDTSFRSAKCPASPSRHRHRTPLALNPVVNMIDNQTIGVETQHRSSRQRAGLAGFDETGPPLDRGSVACADRLSETSFHFVLDGELALAVRQCPVRLGATKRA